MKKANLALSLFVTVMLLAPAGFGFAQSSVDLGDDGAGLLPSNPFYFLKEWGRGFRKFLTFSDVRKARLELDVLNEKAAELKKLDEITPDNTGALLRAAENYKNAAEELRNRLSALKENSENPDIDRLLTQLADRGLKHQQLFDDLEAKFQTDENLRKSLSDLKEELANTLAAASEKLDSPEKLRVRFESLLAEHGGELGELRIAELVDRLEEKLSGDIQKEVSALKDDLLIKFSGRLQGLQLVSASSVPVLINQVSGERVRYLKLLDEVREKVLNPDLKNQLNVSRQRLLEKATEENSIGKEEATQAIEGAKKLIAEVEEKISSRGGNVRASVKALLERAKFNLAQAEKLLEEENFGGAFGQATASYAAARNAWVQLTPDENTNTQTLESLKAYYDSLVKKAGDARLTKEQNPKVFELLTEAEKRIVELSKLVETKAAPEVIAAALRSIKLILATVEELITASLRSAE